MRTTGRIAVWQSLALAIAALGVGCKFASPGAPNGPGPGTGTGGVTGRGGTGGGGGAGGHIPNIGGFPGKDAGADAALPPPLDDFPADPIIDSSAPANAPALFDGTTPRAGGAPCIVSPIAGTLMPRNWLRPRFELAAAAGENLFELDLTVAGFAHPLRIFTRNPGTALDRRALEPAASGRRQDDYGDGARAADRRRGRGPGRAVVARRVDVRDRAGRRAREDRLLGARRRHGDEGRLAEGLRYRRGGRA